MVFIDKLSPIKQTTEGTNGVAEDRARIRSITGGWA